jgi:hypothetical protein
MPKASPATTLFSVETASSSSVVRRSAKTSITAPSEYYASDVKDSKESRFLLLCH